MSFNAVVLRGVAVDAKHIVLAHVHVELRLGHVEAFIEVAVLDRVATAAVEVALTAVLARRRPAHALSRGGKINAVQGYASLAFGVGGHVRMARETIYILGILKIKIGIFPPIADVATGAPGPIPLNADAEIIDCVLFAYLDLLPQPFGPLGLTEPGPVRGLHHLVRGVGMAFEAGSGHLLGRLIRPREQVAMIGGRGPLGHVVPRVHARFGTREEQGQRDKHDKQHAPGQHHPGRSHSSGHGALSHVRIKIPYTCFRFNPIFIRCPVTNVMAKGYGDMRKIILGPRSQQDLRALRAPGARLSRDAARFEMQELESHRGAGKSRRSPCRGRLKPPAILAVPCPAR